MPLLVFTTSDLLPLIQIKGDIERFKSQGVEMEEKRKTILRGLEVRERGGRSERREGGGGEEGRRRGGEQGNVGGN